MVCTRDAEAKRERCSTKKKLGEQEKKLKNEKKKLAGGRGSRDCYRTVGHSAEDDFCVEVVWKRREELRLDGQARGQEVEVVRELVVRGDQDGLARGIELWAARATKDLHHIEHTEIHETTTLQASGSGERGGRVRVWESDESAMRAVLKS